MEPSAPSRPCPGVFHVERWVVSGLAELFAEGPTRAVGFDRSGWMAVGPLGAGVRATRRAAKPPASSQSLTLCLLEGSGRGGSLTWPPGRLAGEVGLSGGCSGGGPVEEAAL